ncbi:MAG: GerMN domain-containing protein [Selenomonadaceae bacterium]|nr:GerMN domain-containing protein [Selenomonadaceae bacterium]
MIKKILISAMTALLLVTSGCDKNNPTEPADNPKKTEVVTPENKDNPDVKSAQTLQVTVYYPDQAGMSLIPVQREIKITDDSQKYIAAVNCLLDAPAEEELTKIFPKDAKIKSITLKGDTAVVDLDSGITKNFVGGSTGEEFLINSVVDTLTEFDEVKQVQFLIDGQEVETLAGHMDLSAPIKR